MVSHPLSLREALGSIPSVSTGGKDGAPGDRGGSFSSESKLTRRKQLFCLDVSFVYLWGAVSRSALRLPGLRFCCWIFWANESAFAALPTMKQADMQSSLGIFQNNFAYSECMAFGSHETFDALMRSSFGIVQDNLAYSGCTAFDNHSIFACKYAKFTRHITI